MTWTLIGVDGRAYESAQPGTLGGHRGTRSYGRLDCPSALRALSRVSNRPSTGSGCVAGGVYRRNRVFFADEASAVAAGFRPCAVCLPRQYREWRTG